MKTLLLSALFVVTVQAQDFSPADGAGIQSSPSGVGGSSLSSPSTIGAGTVTSPSATLNNDSVVQPTPGTPIVPDPNLTGANTGIGPTANTLDTVPSTLNQSPNPLPSDLNTSDTFDTSLIQAQEAEPLEEPQIQTLPGSTTGGGQGSSTEPTSTGQ